MENTEYLSGIWDEAVDKYKSETKADPLPLDSLGTAASAEAILTAIEGNREDFSEESRAKTKSLMDVLKPVVKIVQLMAEVAGEGASLTFAPGKTIFVAIWILLKASDEVSESYNSVIDIFESLDSFLEHLSMHLEHSISGLMKEVMVEILAHLLSILGVATRLIRENRAVTYFQTLIGENSEVQAALEKLDKLTAREGLGAVGTATLSAASQILSQLETRMKADQQGKDVIKTMLIKIAQEAEAISGSSQESRILLEEIREHVMRNTESVLPYFSNHHRSEVHKWLSAPSPVSNKEDNGSLRQAGTGSWFIQSTEYNQWKIKSNSLLWVSGGPGSGKSVLSSTIIRDIEFDTEVDPSVSLAYFYFDFRDSEKERCLGLISSLIDQLASRCSDMPTALERLYAIHRNGMERPTLHNLVAALKEMIMNITCRVYIVIDALDECSERKNVMALIEEITQWNLDNIHMLLTSRKEEDLGRFLMPLSAEVTLESSLVDRDIAFHIRAVLQNDRDFEKWQPPQKLEIETSVMSGAHGMFRWVSCQLDSTRGCRNTRSLTKSLATLPKTLYEPYNTIFNRIDDQDFEYVRATLQWLAFSMCPVTLEEVTEVLAMDFDNVPLRFVPENRFREPRDILTKCSSLVTLSGDGALVLSHLSIKEYLTKITEPNIRRYSFNAGIAHEFIAQTCIAYLMQLTHSVDIEHFPLALYAAKHWMNHVGSAHTDALYELAFDLLQAHSMVFVNWVRIYDVDRDYSNTELSRPPHDIPPPLYYAALAGFVRVSEKLLENGADVNVQCGKYGNALQAASVGGHDAVVERLLKKGADVNAQGGRYSMNALQAASLGGHSTVVQLLFEKGADINAQGGRYGSALQAASLHGSSTIVELLLEKGADVNAQGGKYGNALQAASAGGYSAVVQLLLKKGADVNAQGGEYGSALQAASVGGHSTVVQWLLEKGAEVNAQGGIYGNSLQAASLRGHDAGVEQLLEKGADVNAQGGEYGNALQAASAGGHNAVVERLLEKGADVNAQGGRYGNALQAASAGGHNSVVQRLLEAISTDKITTDDKEKPNNEPVLEKENSQQSVVEREKDPDESHPTPYNMDAPIEDWDSKFFDGQTDLWTIFVVTCSSLLPISQVHFVVEDSVLDHFTYFRELREADQRADDVLMGVVRGIIEEWKTMGASLIALAALDAAVFGFSRDGTIFTVNEAAKYAITMSSIAACVGGVVDVWFLIRYGSCDVALFQSYAKDVFKSYLFFSLSSRIPAFSVFVAATSLAVFMCMVVYTMAPTLVIIFVVFNFVVLFANRLFWVLYQIAYVVSLAMDWVFKKFRVIGRTVLDRISQWFQYIMHQIRP